MGGGKLRVLLDDFVAKPLDLGWLLAAGQLALVQLDVHLGEVSLGVAFLSALALKLSLQLINLRLQLPLTLVQALQLLPQLFPLSCWHIQTLDRLKNGTLLLSLFFFKPRALLVVLLLQLAAVLLERLLELLVNLEFLHFDFLLFVLLL